MQSIVTVNSSVKWIWGPAAPFSRQFQEQPMNTSSAVIAKHGLDLVEGKVPKVNGPFWLIKILATTLGETAGDAVTMSMNLGYLTGSGIFLAIFALAVG